MSNSTGHGVADSPAPVWERFNEPVASSYRISPAFTARLLGGLLVALALLILVFTGIVAVANLATWWLIAPAVIAIVAIAGTGTWVSRANPAVIFTDEGYAVRGFRGVGDRAGRWTDVEDAVTTFRGELPCVQIRLKKGTSTTIPVTLLSTDREQFVRDLQSHLQAGQGYRKL